MDLKSYFERLEAVPVKRSKAKAKTKVKATKRLPPGAVKGFRPVETLPQAAVITDDIPMYLIFAHSAICSPDSLCYKEAPRPPFTIPLDTYLLSFAQPDETFCSTPDPILQNMELIRDYFHLHSVSDITSEASVGVSRFSTFNGVLRAASTPAHPTQYPNIVYGFKPSKDEEDNQNGVYKITDETDHSDIINANSILIDPKRENWFLEDVIREVYAATGVNKGIFILAGCLTSNMKPIDRRALDNAAMMMGYANSIYNTLFETYTADEKKAGLYTMYENEGVNAPLTRLEPGSIVFDSKGVPHEDFRGLPLAMHMNDVKIMRDLYVTKGTRKGPKGAKVAKVKVRRSPRTFKTGSKR